MESSSSSSIFDSPNQPLSTSEILEIFASEYCEVDHVLAANERPLLPTESTLWDPTLVPSLSLPSALPKNNLQFLSLADYLSRELELTRRESFFAIRSDVSESILQMRPRLGFSGDTCFTATCRMAVPLQSFALQSVRRARVGETTPAEVSGEATFSVHGLKGERRRGWESLREHEILFLVRVTARNRDDEFSFGEERRKEGEISATRVEDPLFLEKEGVECVRGCEVVRMEDEDGVVLNDASTPDIREKRAGKRRILHVRLDAAQYQRDMERVAKGEMADPYQSFNLLVRRDPATNNFKAVLQTTRELLALAHMEQIVPAWLKNVLLGLGDPSAAHYSRVAPMTQTIDFTDTFVSARHVVEAFPDYSVSFRSKNGEVLSEETAKPPFRVTFPPRDEDGEEESNELICTAYSSPHSDPYKPSELRSIADSVQKNALRFTPAQVEAIRSGMSAGLTLVVGPPGTGKTDVVVQTISNLYRSFPDQRVLVVTRSNHALNDLFGKIAQRGIEARHVLRLGLGERDLESDADFSRLGRVDYCLQRREKLLEAVKRLAVSLGCLEDVAYSCETAATFFTSVVVPRIQLYQRAMNGGCSESELESLRHLPSGSSSAQRAEEKRWDELNDSEAGHLFPFKLFFLPLQQPIFPASQSEEQRQETCEETLRSVRELFAELKEYRPFELLRSARHRCDYMMGSEARIVAMTCTHAAIARQRLVESGFHFDTLVLEEAGQVLELESFIPMLLQVGKRSNGDVQSVSSVEGCRLKRVILLGDHNQLPPITQSVSLARVTNFDQSLFARLIRLGVPHIQLDAQGRCRPSLASLFAWRYPGLSNLPCVTTAMSANTSLRYDYQMINVDAFEGEGEQEPQPHVLQNRGEAEYVVAFYEYLRLCGYPSETITLLTPYNGQRELLRSLLIERCKKNPLFGMPRRVTTVDKYQGQQNDIVILSLVRTRSLGYLRDVRRMLVAVSRARKGLYVFGRVELFRDCAELKPILSRLLERPTTLQLVEGEYYPTDRENEKEVKAFEVGVGARDER